MIEADIRVDIAVSKKVNTGNATLQQVLIGIGEKLVATIILRDEITLITVHDSRLPFSEIKEVSGMLNDDDPGDPDDQPFFYEVTGIVPIEVRQVDGEQD